MNSSARVQTSFTGLPAAFASRAASTASSPVCLPPYADPVSGTMTRTWSSGMRNASASSRAHAERPLRAGPDRQLAVAPLGDGGARFERHVRDVRNSVGRVERARAAARAADDVARAIGRSAPAAAGVPVFFRCS